MKKKWLLMILFVILLIGFAACNQDKPAAETENEVEITALEEEQAKQTIKNFREVFMKVVNNTEDDGQVKGFQSKDELKEEFTDHMSEKQAEAFLEGYFEEKDDNLYVIATEAPFWIDEEKEFALDQVDVTEYEVQQEINNEVAGRQRVTYVLTPQEGQWIVEELQAEQLDEEDSSSQDSQTENNHNSETDSPNDTQEEIDSETSSTPPNKESDQNSTEENQSEATEEEGPEDVSDGEITEDEAEELVRKHLNIPEDSNLHVVMDHLDNNENYVVQVYEVVSDGGVGHTATVGWYIVDREDGSIEQMM